MVEENHRSTLLNIFGHDFTESLILSTLRENSNDFDLTVEKLLATPSNKPAGPPAPATNQQQITTHQRENIKKLQCMFNDLSQSVITTVYESNRHDVEETVDTLLNMTSNDVAQGMKEAPVDDVAQQEAEIRQYQQFIKLQNEMQEKEKKRMERRKRGRRRRRGRRRKGRRWMRRRGGR